MRSSAICGIMWRVARRVTGRPRSGKAYRHEGIDSNGSRCVFWTKRPHRGGISPDEAQRSGKLHRTDGPAMITFHSNGSEARRSYWVDGNLYWATAPTNPHGKIVWDDQRNTTRADWEKALRDAGYAIEDD